MSNNIFLKPVEFYRRDLNPIKHSVEQNAFYISKMASVNMDDAKAFIQRAIKEKKFQDLVDPEVHYFERDETTGDKDTARIRLSQYISSAVKDDLVIAPTFTCYVPSYRRESLLVKFIDRNVKKRSIHKKAAAKAKAEKKMELFSLENSNQDNYKRYNNSMSGGFVAGGTVINNPTAHSTLTSTIRTVSSLGNASNEKVISGNRHYRDPKVTLANLIAITSSVNTEELTAVMQKYNLKYPTCEDVAACILHSTQFYWKDDREFAKIFGFVQKLTPLERAAFVYTGDLYHLRIHNPEFVQGFLEQLGSKIEGQNFEEPGKKIHEIDELVVNFVHLICMNELKGIGKDYSKISHEMCCTVLATSLNVVKVVEDHRDFINAIFLTRNLPCSTAYIRNMTRRAVVLSDTDSTMFSVDEWVMWRYGDLVYHEKARQLAAGVMFMATQMIAHNLAMFSANMGVAKDRLFLLAMKPEFAFDVFCQTPVAKHYFTCVNVKEGSVYEEFEMEIKGVHLKNSALPGEINKMAHARMRFIIEQIVAGKKISLLNELRLASELEQKILDSLLKGDVAYYKSAKIKEAEGYAEGPEKSPFQHYTFWNETFGHKYGMAPQPTYMVVKVPTKLTTKTAVKNWLDGMQDQELAMRIRHTLQRRNKLTFPTFYVPKEYAQSFGVPKEILSVTDTDKIILDMTYSRRMILETLGWFPKSGLLIKDHGY